MFGSPNTFGTPNKPTGFGAPLNFGTPAATATPATNFSFGNQQGSQPRLGGFGTPATGSAFGATAPNTSFGGFGAPAATSAPAFGTSFGTPTPSTTNIFGTPAAVAKPSLFGTTTTPSLFSTPATSAPLFSSQVPTQTPSLFGTPAASSAPLFGAATTTTAPSLFGTSFGTATTTTPSLFGATPSVGSFGGFKTGPGITSTGFGGFGTGTGTTLGGGGFGTTFGSTGGFSFNNAGAGLFAKPADASQQLQQAQDNKAQQTLASFYAINVFGDERDDILKKWNMLQACWGTGRGFYNSQQPPVEYDTCNPFYRFKAISYVVIPTMDNADGYVKIIFAKKEGEITAQKATIINGLNGVLGNKPNLTVCIVHIKALSDNETEMMITVSEKGVTGTSRKIQATDLAAFFNQPAQKQQLAGAGATAISAYVAPSKAQLEEYLKEPPPGIDEQLWKAAQIDNPMPSKYLPMPIMGFANLKKRMLCEEFETGLHQGFLAKVSKEITELKKKHAASLAQIAEQKQKFLQLQHRVLKILVKQECTRKIGLVLQPEEEILKGRLEMMYTHLNMPTQFRGKINEMLSTLKIDSYCRDNGTKHQQTQNQSNAKNEIYKMDPDGQEEIKQFLIMQQKGISHLLTIISQDVHDLKIITEGMNQLLPN